MRYCACANLDHVTSQGGSHFEFYLLFVGRVVKVISHASSCATLSAQVYDSAQIEVGLYKCTVLYVVMLNVVIYAFLLCLFLLHDNAAILQAVRANLE